MATSACGWCEECSIVMDCNTPADVAKRGTWGRQEACSREQALADCNEDGASVCGSKTEAFNMEYQ